jgi:hypothetical protein
MTRIRPSPSSATIVAEVFALLTTSTTFAPAALAAEYFVNNGSASCTNTGAGTAAEPYCSITAALTAHHEPGVVITVMPGRYREQVTVPASGFAGSPITLRAQPGAGPVVVDGTDDFSDPARWAAYSGNVWLASSVTLAPKQVFADDQRLAASTAPPASLPSRSFTFVAGSGLYVNAGGGNPGTHRTQVGSRLRGFFASGRSFIVIRGFTVTRCEDRCIQLTNSSDNVVEGNTLTYSGAFGMQASGDARDRVVSNRSSNNAGHGFSFINGTTGTTIENNDGFDNADPNIRVANGCYLSTSATQNLIRGNRWHHNQDTGEQFSPGAFDNVSVQNCSWANGDHGYDHNRATGTIHINDVAFGNFKDGFSIEGSSTGTQLFNSIAIENGVTTNEYDLWVDSTSTAGFQSNDNVLWNSGPQPPVKVAQSVYPTVAGYSAGRAQDTRTMQADPRFGDPANGDFHLTAGSPAIDNANSEIPGWPSTDVEGNARRDDPGMPNNGRGPVTFADRGAFEFLGSTPGANQPPVARLTASPASGTAPLDVTLDASASSDPDGRVVSYRFEFGDGATAGPQSTPTASHTYGAGQLDRARDRDRRQGRHRLGVRHRHRDRADSEPAAGGTAHRVAGLGHGTARRHARRSASSDADGASSPTGSSSATAPPPGPQSTPTASHTYAAGNWTARVTVTDDKGATASASATVTVTAPAANQPPVARLTASPSRARRRSTSRSTPRRRAIRWPRRLLPVRVRRRRHAGPQSTPTANHTYGAGNWTARVTVTDDKGATASATPA